MRVGRKLNVIIFQPKFSAVNFGNSWITLPKDEFNRRSPMFVAFWIELIYRFRVLDLVVGDRLRSLYCLGWSSVTLPGSLPLGAARHVNRPRMWPRHRSSYLKKDKAHTHYRGVNNTTAAYPPHPTHQPRWVEAVILSQSNKDSHPTMPNYCRAWNTGPTVPTISFPYGHREPSVGL